MSIRSLFDGMTLEDAIRSVAEVTDDAVLIADAEPVGGPRGPRVVWANPAFTRLTGYTMEEVVGKTPRILQGAGTDRATLDRIAAALHGWKPVREVVLNYRKDGTPFWSDLNIRPVADGTGWYRYWVSVQRDVTALKMSEQRALEAQARAEEASQAKSRFLATASHDLRQPLNAMSLLLGVLERRALGDGVKEALAHMRLSLDGMLDLFNGLLDLSAFDTGTVQPRVVQVALGPMLARVCADHAPMAAAKGLALRSVSTAVAVRSDPVLLERMLRNLVSNAVRHTERGRVLVGVRRQGAWARVDVLDTGPGIAEADQSRIFQEFTQLSNPARNGGQGHGLGLAIVARSAALLDHPLALASLPGRGSRFSVTLPLDRRALDRRRAAAAAGPGRPGAAVETLVVEDDAIIGMAMKAVLTDMGCDCTLAPDGERALALIQDGLRPQLILADYRMPGAVNGLEFLCGARALLGAGPVMGLVTGDLEPALVTATANLEARCLHKPVVAKDIAALVRAARAAGAPSREAG